MATPAIQNPNTSPFLFKILLLQIINICEDFILKQNVYG